MSTGTMRVKLEVEKYGYEYSAELYSNRASDEGSDLIHMARQCIEHMMPLADRE